MSFTSILDDIGHGLKVFFTDATKVAVAAEPIVDMAFPGIASLYNLTVNAVSNAETAAIAASAQTGTGPQKLALVMAAIENDFAAYAKTTGISYNATTIQNWINAVVASLNAIPAASSASASTSISNSQPITQVPASTSTSNSQFTTQVPASASSGTLL
jgi:hypothetical protein